MMKKPKNRVLGTAQIAYALLCTLSISSIGFAKPNKDPQKTLAEICKTHGGIAPDQENQSVELKALKIKLSDPKLLKELKMKEKDVKDLTIDAVTLLPDLLEPLFEKKNLQKLLPFLMKYLAKSLMRTTLKDIIRKFTNKKFQIKKQARWSQS
jgi:hypothetical protein